MRTGSNAWIRLGALGALFSGSVVFVQLPISLWAGNAGEFQSSPWHLLALAVAAVLAWATWQIYMGTPWTRDGTVLAYVVTMAPEVAGRIVKLAVADNQFVHKGEVLFVAGEVADCGYVIQEGSFRLETRSRLAADVMVEAGTLLGELALIAETKRPATAMASEPSSVIRISRTLFLKMLEGYPEAAGIMREQIVRRAQQTVKDMTDVRALLDTSQQPGQ